MPGVTAAESTLRSAVVSAGRAAGLADTAIDRLWSAVCGLLDREIEEANYARFKQAMGRGSSS